MRACSADRCLRTLKQSLVSALHFLNVSYTIMKEVSGGDIKQESLSDCWIMASLTALANVPGGLQRICVAHDTKLGIYGFVFYRDGEWIYSIINDKLDLQSSLRDSQSTQRDLLQQIDCEDNENVYRKAYQTGSKALFLVGSWIGEGVEDLSGGVTNELLTSDVLDIGEFWDKEMSRVNDEFLFGASTGLLERGYGERNGISEGQGYVVIETRTLRSGQLLDSPNPEDYIVRSHHNYLMERSVSVELPDLPTGSYVVYLKVTSEQDSNAQSVEQVVKREAADRTENKKLAQVGYA
ncbi:Uncharacterized protein HZ326_21530 [Fusarium oxysporum f. sp. albedinis]|nr:Uncharacterized protein HZ326_21530 [Fusarium oxysporum f. sp. albedinis]